MGISLYSSMDRALVFETKDTGSNPVRGTGETAGLGYQKFESFISDALIRLEVWQWSLNPLKPQFITFSPIPT